MDIEQLIKISNEYGFVSITKQLEAIKNDEANRSLNVMLVGDYSSGKSTFINALLDNPCLEVDDNPTTSIVCSVRFCCPKFKIDGIFNDGNIRSIELHKDGNGRETIRNSEYEDKVVSLMIEDTSTKIPSDIILYDTPGIMSLDPKHREVLLNVLPQGDAFFIVCSAHTASLGNELVHFIKDNFIDSYPLNVIYTHCDQKNQEEVKLLPNIAKNTKGLNINEVSLTSAGAENPNLDNFFDVLNQLLCQKNKLLNISRNKRIRKVQDVLVRRLEECVKLYEDSSFNKKEALARKLDILQIQTKVRATAEEFRDELSKKIIEIKDKSIKVANKSLTDIASKISPERRDKLFRSSINSLRTSSINCFGKEARKILLDFSDRKISTLNDTVSMEALAAITLPTFNIDAMDYIPNLSNVGHQYDKVAATAIKAGLTLLSTYAQSQGIPIPNSSTVINAIPVPDKSSSSVDIPTEDSSPSAQEIQPYDVEPFIGPYAAISNIRENSGNDIVNDLVGRVTDNFAEQKRIEVVLDFVEHSLSKVIDSDLFRYTDIVTTNVQNCLSENAKIIVDEISENVKKMEDDFEKKNEMVKTMKSIINELKNEEQ